MGDRMTQKEKKQIIETAQQFDGIIVSMAHALQVLAEAKEQNANIYVETSSGQKLYALIDDEEACYQKVYGMSKQEREDMLEKEEEARVQEEMKALEKIPARVERGFKIIDREHKKWDDCVVARTKGMFYGEDIDHALDVMEIIKTGDYEKAYQKLLESGHSRESWELIRSIITTFLKNGKKFYEYILSVSEEEKD